MKRFILIAVCLLLATESVHAQWNLLATFPGDVHCIYFMPQRSNVGFVGLGNGRIYKTTDAGVSWSFITTVTGGTEINSFAFKDSLTGWLSCSLNNWPWPCIYRTVDGGASWNAVPGISGACSQVWYSKVTRKVTADLWYTNNMESTDDGVSWNSTAISGKNSTAWISDSVGIMSCTTLSPSFLYTKNGGATWSTSSLGTECFAPCGVSCTGLFFAATEFGGTVFRSSDSGATWSVAKSNTYGTVPGCVQANSTHLFQQTNSSVQMSTNQGATWSNIGGPGAIFDHRFCLINGLVYAGDTSGHLYLDTNYRQPPEGTFTLNTQRIAMQPAPCASSDTVIFPLTGGCVNITVLQINQVGNSSHFTVSPTMTLPRSISSVGVHVTFDGLQTDSDRIHIRYTNGAVTTDTTIRIAGTASPVHSLALDTQDTVITPVSCQDSSILLPIRNSYCDTMWISSIMLDDVQHFHLSVPPLPLGLRTESGITLPVQTTSHSSGTYTAHVRLHYHTRYTQGDTTITIVYRVLADRRIALAVRDTMVTSMACSDSSMTVRITNVHCDSVTITSSGLDDLIHFQIVSNLPATVASGASLPIVIRTTSHVAGSYLGHLRLHYANGSISGDTTIALYYRVLAQRNIALALRDTVVTPGACSDSVIRLPIANLECDTTWITTLSLDDPQHFSLNASSLPIQILPGNTAILSVRTSSHRSGQFLAHVRIHYANAYQSGDTTITFYYTVQSEGHPLVLAQNIVVANACVHSDSSVLISNASCDTLTVANAKVLGIGELSVAGLTFPIRIPPGAYLRILLEIQATFAMQASGLLSVAMSNAGGTFDTTIPISLIVSSGARPMISANPISVLNGCVTHNTTLFVVNPSCDTLAIQAASLTGLSGLTFPAGFFPKRIAPGDTLSLPLLVNAAHPVVLNGFIHMTLAIRAWNTDTVIAIQFIVRQDIRPVAVLSNHTIDFGATSICFAKEARATLSNPLCTPLTIESVRMRAGVVFSTSSSHAYPKVLQPGMTDTISIRFAPSAAGNLSDQILVALSANGTKSDTTLTAVGLATTSLVVDLEPASVNIDTILACDSRRSGFVVTNHYCEPIEISAPRFQQSGFTIGWSQALPYWLSPGYSIRGTVDFASAIAGSVTDSVILSGRDSSGGQWEQTLHLLANVKAPKTAFGLSASILQLDSLPPCSNFDTTIFLTNVSLCDAALSTAVMSNLSGAILTIEPPSGTTISPGSRVSVHFHLHPMPGDTGSGVIAFSGKLFDTLVRVHYSTSYRSLATATLSTTSLVLHTSACGSTDSSMEVRNDGCAPITIDALVLSDSSNFVLTQLPSLPLVLQSGESFSFRARFDASSLGHDSARVDLNFNHGGFTRSVSLVGKPAPHSIASLSMVLDSSSRIAGAEQRVVLHLDSAVARSQSLTTISALVAYQSGMLTYVRTLGVNGWNVATQAVDANHLRLVCSSPVGSDHKAGEAIASLSLRYSVGDTMKSDVALSDLHFNPDNPSFERCILAPQTFGVLHLALDPSCGDQLLSTYLQTHLITYLRTSPNPATSSPTTQAYFELTRKAVIHLELQSILGTTVYEWSGELPSGEQSLPLAISELPSGVYYAKLNGENETMTQKLIVDH